MRKFIYPRLMAGLLLIGSLASCNLPLTQIPQTETNTPASTISPAETDTPTPIASFLGTSTSTPLASDFTVLNTSTPKFAPFCQPSSAVVFTPTPFQCQLPIAEQSSLYCSNKAPYNLILINIGSTYEVSNENITCSDGGRKDGQQILICTGPMALPFDLEVCDPSCALPRFNPGTTHCPENYTFNESRGCCGQGQQPVDQNCVVLKLETRSCVINCAVYTDQTTCDKNAYACTWDAEFKMCQRRK